MAYVCKECGNLHTKAVEECRYCGHGRVEESLAQRTGGDYETVSDASAGTSRGPDAPSAPSPDVNADGSLADATDVDTEEQSRHLRSSAHVAGLRASTTGRTVVRVVALALVLVGAANLLLFQTDPVLGFYRSPLLAILPSSAVFGSAMAGVLLPDVVLMVVGAAFVWFLD